MGDHVGICKSGFKPSLMGMNYVRVNASHKEKALNSKSPFLEILDSITLLNWLNGLTPKVLRD